MGSFFSVIVPVYNVVDFIDRCMESLLEQSFQDIEIVLVDDGSTDTSGEVCDAYAKKYPHVFAIHKRNGGLASARNEGLEFASGQYISFVDSDDWIEQDAYKILYERIQNEKPDIINFGYRKFWNNKVTDRGCAIFVEGLYDKAQIKARILPDSIANKTAFHQTKLSTQMSACMCVYRREFLFEHGLRFESERIVLSEDWLFNISCLCRAQSFSVMHDLLYNYDIRGNSLSMSYKPDAYERRKTLYRRYCEEIKTTENMNAVIRQRLNNFWLEMIYGCFSIELNLGKWNCRTRGRLREFCEDIEFVRISGEMDIRNCTAKGAVFLWLAKQKMIGVIWFMNWIRRCYRNSRS